MENASKNVESAHHSMKNTFVHIQSVYNGWINYNALGKSNEIPWEEHDYNNYHSMGQIRDKIMKVLAGVNVFLKGLGERGSL